MVNGPILIRERQLFGHCYALWRKRDGDIEFWAFGSARGYYCNPKDAIWFSNRKQVEYNMARGIGRHISRCRHQAGFAYDELAKRLKIPARKLLDWETGQSIPSPAEARRLTKLMSHYITF